MVAVITRSPAAGTSRAPRPNLVLIPGGQGSSPVRVFAPLDCPAPASATGFRIVAQPKRSVLRHWRLAAVLMIALAVITGGWLVVRAIGGLGGGGSLTSSGEPVMTAAGAGGAVGDSNATAYPAAAQTGVSQSGASQAGVSQAGVSTDIHPTQGRAWVVRPGDTLWGIVQAAGVRGDPRPVVDKMAAALRGQPLQVGQSVTVP